MTMNSYQLPDDDLALIETVRTKLETAWRVIGARVIARVAESDIPAMLIYEAFANKCGKRSVTVRTWARYEKRFGEALDELPEGYVSIEQLRCVEAQARAGGRPPLEVLLARVNESDSYGGVFCPVDVYRLQLGGHKPKEERPDLAALERASNSLAKFCKANAKLRRRGEMVMAEIETLKRMARKQ